MRDDVSQCQNMLKGAEGYLYRGMNTDLVYLEPLIFHQPAPSENVAGEFLSMYELNGFVVASPGLTNIPERLTLIDGLQYKGLDKSLTLYDSNEAPILTVATNRLY